MFIFTSDSSALLWRPRCGLSTWLPLPAIFSTLLWVYAKVFFSFHDKTAKARKYSKSADLNTYNNFCILIGWEHVSLSQTVQKRDIESAKIWNWKWLTLKISSESPNPNVSVSTVICIHSLVMFLFNFPPFLDSFWSDGFMWSGGSLQWNEGKSYSECWLFLR